MMHVTLRSALFAALALVGGLMSGCSSSTNASSNMEVGAGPSFKGPAGLQLYSLRALFTAKGPSTLDLVKSYGVKEIELAGTYNLTPAQLKAEIDARGLIPVAGHFPYTRFRDEPEKVAQEAKVLGLRYAGCASIPREGKFDAKQAREAVAVFNKAGDILAKEGIMFFYHCHGFEFEPGISPDGSLAMDILIRETNPRTVAFEMDVLWVVFPGQAPEKWLAKYPGRWHMMHLKDLRRGVATGEHTGKTDVENDVVLGTGQMNWPVILAAAKKSGVKHYFIEDESSDAPNQIPKSLRYLEQVHW